MRVMGNKYHIDVVLFCTPPNRYDAILDNITIVAEDNGYKQLDYTVYLKKDGERFLIGFIAPHNKEEFQHIVDTANDLVLCYTVLVDNTINMLLTDSKKYKEELKEWKKENKRLNKEILKKPKYTID